MAAEGTGCRWVFQGKIGHRTLDVTVPNSQFVELAVDLVGCVDCVRIGQQRSEGLSHTGVGLAPAEPSGLLRGLVRQGVATVGQPTFGLRLVQAQRVCVQRGPRGGDSTACRGAHRAGWDSIP